MTIFTWTGLFDSITWANNGNWTPSGFPNTNADIANFNSTSDSIDTGAARTIGSLTTSSGFTGSITLGGNLIVDDAGGESGAINIGAGTFNGNGFDVSTDGVFRSTGGTINCGSGTIDVNNFVTLSGFGALNLDSCRLEVEDGITLSNGTFSSGTSRIVLNGTPVSRADIDSAIVGTTFNIIEVTNTAVLGVAFTISGSGTIAMNELVADAASADILIGFFSGNVGQIDYTIDTLSLTGTGSNHVILEKRFGANSRWGIIVTGQQTVDHVDVTDSDNSSSTFVIDAIDVSNIDGGNNLAWDFEASSSSTSATSSTSTSDTTSTSTSATSSSSTSDTSSTSTSDTTSTSTSATSSSSTSATSSTSTSATSSSSTSATSSTSTSSTSTSATTSTSTSDTTSTSTSATTSTSTSDTTSTSTSATTSTSTSDTTSTSTSATTSTSTSSTTSTSTSSTSSTSSSSFSRSETSSTSSTSSSSSEDDAVIGAAIFEPITVANRAVGNGFRRGSIVRFKGKNRVVLGLRMAEVSTPTRTCDPPGVQDPPAVRGVPAITGAVCPRVPIKLTVTHVKILNEFVPIFKVKLIRI